MIETFSDFAQFKSKAKEIGVSVNLDELLGVNGIFLESYEDYVIISLKDYADNTTNVLSANILVLSEKDALLYSERKTFGEKDYKFFRNTLQKPYGEPTVLTLLMLRDVLANYQTAFKAIDEKIDVLEKRYDIDSAEEITVVLRKLTNRTEGFTHLLVSLEERKIIHVNTSYVAYDYKLVLTKGQYLLDRCRNHLNQLRDIQHEADMKQTRETNKRIEDLTVTVKRLTALTIVLMIPTIIAGHFGMNFKYMPELDVPWAYPAVIIAQIVITLGVAWYLKKKGWF